LNYDQQDKVFSAILRGNLDINALAESAAGRPNERAQGRDSFAVFADQASGHSWIATDSDARAAWVNALTFKLKRIWFSGQYF
jgi:hypothetical protein